jgi:hypothetical protein
MTERNNVALKFVTNLSDAVSINVPRARKNLTLTQANNIMDNIIATGIVLIKGGRPITKDGAVLNLTTIALWYQSG